MPKLLLNCDQVFDVLTRGPFPAGESSDGAVEQHLRACHDCRRLAEALRPAVTLLHEAISGDEACGLPEYQGVLPERRSLARPPQVSRPLVRGMRQLPRAANAAPPRSRLENVLMAVRLAAASVLMAALGVLLYGFSAGTTSRPTTPASDRPASVAITKSLPTADGFMQLASLRLPAKCFPADYQASSAQHAALLLAAMEEGTLAALQCCTECHHAAAALRGNAVAAMQQQCQVCHRG